MDTSFPWRFTATLNGCTVIREYYRTEEAAKKYGAYLRSLNKGYAIFVEPAYGMRLHTKKLAG